MENHRYIFVLGHAFMALFFLLGVIHLKQLKRPIRAFDIFQIIMNITFFVMQLNLWLQGK